MYVLPQLCLAGVTDEAPTGALIRTVKMEVMAALEELRVITTHDDNLERQYRESKLRVIQTSALLLAFYVCKAVAENTKLQMDLDKARRELRVCTFDVTFTLDKVRCSLASTASQGAAVNITDDTSRYPRGEGKNSAERKKKRRTVELIMSVAYVEHNLTLKYNGSYLEISY